MAAPIFYRGRGTPDMYDDLMDFMNYVFGFDGDGKDFKKLLPKLYNREYDPCWSNYVVTEDGKLKAAIGAYDSALSVNGEILKGRGIGNVAVHPYARGKGYMKDCMHLALKDMIADGVDYSILGGQRQRYQHFGYDYGGQQLAIDVDRGNLRRAFENVPLDAPELKKISAEESELIAKMHALHASRPMHSVRTPENFFDVARSWRAEVWAVLKDGEFRGYFINDLQELTLVDPADLRDVVRAYVAEHGSAHITLPIWDTGTAAALTEYSGGVSLHHCEMFNILRYRRMTDVLLRFKASRESLGDGELTLLVHGFAGDEKFRIAVKDNAVSVEDTDAEPDLELGHFDATAFLFGIFSGFRTALTPAVRSWFPLPLFVEGADHV